MVEGSTGKYKLELQNKTATPAYKHIFMGVYDQLRQAKHGWHYFTPEQHAEYFITGIAERAEERIKPVEHLSRETIDIEVRERMGAHLLVYSGTEEFGEIAKDLSSV